VSFCFPDPTNTFYILVGQALCQVFIFRKWGSVGENKILQVGRKGYWAGYGILIEYDMGAN